MLLVVMTQTDPTKRGEHPKGHGCVVATFTVLKDIADDELRIGLFARPQSYKAVIRFSNAAFVTDGQPEIHGMAIKVLGVSGEKILSSGAERETQDFVLSDQPAFFAKDVATFADFFEARAMSVLKNDASIMKAFINKYPPVVPMRDFSRKAPPSPLDNDYWSQTPYRLGNLAVKYAVKHHPEHASGRIDRTSRNYLRDQLVDHLALKKKPAGFDFYIQRQADPIATPIEDATAIWTTPETRVATITIDPQDFDTADLNKMCEDALSFNPWNSLKDHQPLGGINRARRVIYQKSSALRHAKTNTPFFEPDAESLQN